MPSQVSAEPPQTQTAQMQETAEPLPVAKVQTAPEPEEYPHIDEEIPPPYFDEAYAYEDSHRADVMEVLQPVVSEEEEEMKKSFSSLLCLSLKLRIGTALSNDLPVN